MCFRRRRARTSCNPCRMQGHNVISRDTPALVRCALHLQPWQVCCCSGPFARRNRKSQRPHCSEVALPCSSAAAAAQVLHCLSRPPHMVASSLPETFAQQGSPGSQICMQQHISQPPRYAAIGYRVCCTDVALPQPASSYNRVISASCACAARSPGSKICMWHHLMCTS